MPIHVLKYKKKEGKYDFNMIKDWLDEFVRGKVYVAILTDINLKLLKLKLMLGTLRVRHG